MEAAAECYPKARWQRCVVHWYRNVFSHVPHGQLDVVARMLKAIHAQEDRKAAALKAKAVVTKLTAPKLREAATLVRETVAQTLTSYAFPSTHWRQIRTNNPLERIIREVRRRTRVVGAFPDGQSALMLVAARLRHIAATKSLRNAISLSNYYRHRGDNDQRRRYSDRGFTDLKVRKTLDRTWLGGRPVSSTNHGRLSQVE